MRPDYITLFGNQLFWHDLLHVSLFKPDLLHHITVELYGLYMCMVSLEEKVAYISIKFYFPIFIPFITLTCQHSFELLIDHFQWISFFLSFSSSENFMKLCSTISLAKNVRECLVWKKEHTLFITCKLDFLLAKWPWADSILSHSIWLLICEMKKPGWEFLRDFLALKVLWSNMF